MQLVKSRGKFKIYNESFSFIRGGFEGRKRDKSPFLMSLTLQGRIRIIIRKDNIRLNKMNKIVLL